MRKQVRFPFRKGILAAPARVWGDVFDVIAPEMLLAKPFAEEGNCAVVDICGPLEQHSSWCCDSYDDIRARAEKAFASSKEVVVLRINSPGGDFVGSVELSRALREMAASAGKRLLAYTDSAALSAAYALACAAESITITESAFVGSVGVWAALVDETARDRAMGVNIVIVPSGSRKADRNPHVAISEESIANMQSQVDGMASIFFDLVAEHRGMSRADVESLQGGESFGRRALALGLADSIVNSWGEFLASTVQGKPMAKSYDEAMKQAREALAKVAEGDDEDAKAARAALAKLGAEDEDMKKDEEKKDEAKAEGDEKDPKAADEKEEPKAAAKLGAPRLVAASTPRELDLAQRIHALEAERAQEKEDAERAKLLSSRPDFSAEVRATLAASPLEIVRNAVAKWPRVNAPVANAAAATTPGGTRGVSQTDSVNLSNSDLSFIKAKMGRAENKGGVVHEGCSLTLGYMTPEEAKAAADRLAAKGRV